MRRDRDTQDRISERDVLSLGSPLVRIVESHAEIPSTQVRAVELARAGVRDLLVVAAVQTGGKGRMGHGWRSPEGGLWTSIVVAPELPAERASRLTQSASLAVAKSLRDLGVDVRIKWPNDLLVEGGKICGVLAESSLRRDPQTGLSVLDHAVVGIGVNANLDATSLPVPDSGLPPTSIRASLGRDVPLVTLLDGILRHLRVELDRIDDFSETLLELRSLSCTLGRRIRVRRLGEPLQGLATDLTEEGALIVSTQTGLIELFEGDIELLREDRPNLPQKH